MATLTQRVARMFYRAWNAYGQPTATVVRPLADWNLPAGFSYDERLDRITNSSQAVIRNPEDYWVTDTVYIVPNQNPNELRSLMAAGLVPAGTIEIGVMEADAATIENAHAVQVNGQWYDVSYIEQGIQAGWRMARLTRRS